MREDKLGDLSMELSVDILQLTKELRAKRENVISNQIGRSATSICANIAESKYAHGCADFIAKLEIALKEASETEYWLELLHESGYIDNQTAFESVYQDCQEILSILAAITKTQKESRL